ncbi:MAG: molybdopterin molybdotransferase MoeA [Chloroflexaceae bacterium]|nr:molybdopterin molybdotransferase MoeA [Chloroflexaceae bacterium]
MPDRDPYPTSLSVDEALRQVLAICPRLPSELVALGDAAERVLAADVVAGFSLPSFANAAMDGFAVRSADVLAGSAPSGSSPAACPLRVVGESVAGHGFAGEVEDGTAVRIMTGAAVPVGADAVVPLEETMPGEGGEEKMVWIPRQAVRPGQHLRQVGEDVAAGATVLRAGRVLAPQDIGLLAALGVAEVAVVRRPRVAILATGDELVPVGAPMEPGPGQVRDTNTPMLVALVTRYGGIPMALGIARDTEASLWQRLQEAFDYSPDLLLTTAGVSVGDYDLVKEVLALRGTIVFWKVRMKPGKPLVAGVLEVPDVPGVGQRQGTRHEEQRRTVPMLGLPGNPSSAFTVSEVFVRSALRHMQGRGACPPRVWARLDEAVQGTTRQSYLPVRVYATDRGYGVARCGVGRGSHAISTLVEANSLLMVPAQGGYRAGEMVEVVPLAGWGEGAEERAEERAEEEAGEATNGGSTRI